MRSAYCTCAYAFLAASFLACDKPQTASGDAGSLSGSASATSHLPSAIAANGSAGARTEPNRAAKVFQNRCAACHGPKGIGDGPSAAILNPKPRDYSQADWQKSVTDDDIRNVIVQGGQVLGKSALMPASPDLANDKATLDGLVAIVRNFGK